MDNNSAVSCLRFEMTYYCYYVSLPDISLKSFPFFAVHTMYKLYMDTFFFLPKMKWYFVTKIVLTYCEKNCSSDREIWGWRPRICKNFEITWTIYSNSERSEQFLVTDDFFNLFLEVPQISKIDNYNSNGDRG